MARVAVIGAGIVGLACAAQLRLRGHQISIIDPVPPGEHCSFGNAGCLSSASFVPLGLPGMWKKVPRWLLDPSGPLAIPARNALRVAPWLWRLHRSTTMERVEKIADALAPLLAPTVRKWRPLAAWAGVPELIRQDGYALAYETDAGFLGDALGRRLREERGVRIEILRGDEIRAFDASLSPHLRHLVLLPEQGHCPNPLRLSRALARRLLDDGTQLLARTATGFDIRDGRVSAVRTDGAAVAADAVVVAAGARSHSLSALLGDPVWLETERGYHVTLAAPSVVPKIPLMSGEGKYFVTPMEEGLRVAGTVELAGLDAAPNYARAEPLLAGARRLLPGLRFEGSTRWMGHRPSLPDSKPVIGRSAAAANAFYAFGHGHVGLTAAAPTSEVVADLVDGREPFLDIGPFAADRDAIRRAKPMRLAAARRAA